MPPTGPVKPVDRKCDRGALNWLRPTADRIVEITSDDSDDSVF